ARPNPAWRTRSVIHSPACRPCCSFATVVDVSSLPRMAVPAVRWTEVKAIAAMARADTTSSTVRPASARLPRSPRSCPREARLLELRLIGNHPLQDGARELGDFDRDPLEPGLSDVVLDLHRSLRQARREDRLEAGVRPRRAGG